MATANALRGIAGTSYGQQAYDELQQTKKQGIYDTGVCAAYGKFTATVAGTSIAGGEVLFTLPPGRILLFPHISYVSATAGVSTADLHIGHGAYVQQDGTAVGADDNEWTDNMDVGGGVVNQPFTGTGTALSGVFAALPYNSKAGIPVTMLVDTEDISIGDTVEVVIFYTKEGSH